MKKILINVLKETVEIAIIIIFSRIFKTLNFSKLKENVLQVLNTNKKNEIDNKEEIIQMGFDLRG